MSIMRKITILVGKCRGTASRAQRLEGSVAFGMIREKCLPACRDPASILLQLPDLFFNLT
jgi:hypothetical protein